MFSKKRFFFKFTPAGRGRFAEQQGKEKKKQTDTRNFFHGLSIKIPQGGISESTNKTPASQVLWR